MATTAASKGISKTLVASAQRVNRRGLLLRRVLPLIVLSGALVFGPVAISVGSASASTNSSAAASLSAARIAALSAVVVSRLNAIRVSFGLPAGTYTTAYTAEVLKGIEGNDDPTFAPPVAGVVGEESLWGVLPGTSAPTLSSPLVVVNGWVYHDGWGGSLRATWNADCTSPTAAGCNGHRRAVLSKPPVAGAKLSIDVTTRLVRFDGSQSLAVAALMVWKTSTAS